MARERLQQLHDAGTAIWLDYIERAFVRDGELSRRIERDVLTGLTSNPTIFEKALAEGGAYDEQLASLDAEATPQEMFEQIAADDVRGACDLFRAIYDDTGGADGFVSLEVSPSSAHDSAATVAEAHRLWELVDRPNLMIKVPGTEEGVEAVRRLIADGLNVNVTLLFAVEAYRSVIEAYLEGLEERLRGGRSVEGIGSVASFFISRVDGAVDARLEKIGSIEAHDLMGKAAVANAKLAYALFRDVTQSERWRALAERGARVQRPLWASTSTKNPAYRDVVYVEDLIGPDTVNTMPPATVEAFADHGQVSRTVDNDVEVARRDIARLTSLGVDIDQVTDSLLVEGLKAFQKSYDALITRLAERARTVSA